MRIVHYPDELIRLKNSSPVHYFNFRIEQSPILCATSGRLQGDLIVMLRLSGYAFWNILSLCSATGQISLLPRSNRADVPGLYAEMTSLLPLALVGTWLPTFLALPTRRLRSVKALPAAFHIQYDSHGLKPLFKASSITRVRLLVGCALPTQRDRKSHTQYAVQPIEI